MTEPRQYLLYDLLLRNFWASNFPNIEALFRQRHPDKECSRTLLASWHAQFRLTLIYLRKQGVIDEEKFQALQESPPPQPSPPLPSSSSKRPMYRDKKSRFRPWHFSG